MSDAQMLVAGARFASIVLSSISTAASVVVLISYTRTVRRIRAHHRQIINASNLPPPPIPAYSPRSFFLEPPPPIRTASAKPYAPASYKKPRSFRRIHLPCPLEYYNRMAASLSHERLHLHYQQQQQRRLPRMPSSKIAVLSAIDLAVHLSWIANTANSQSACTASLFFVNASLLLYMLFLAAFAVTSLLRLRLLRVSPARQFNSPGRRPHTGARSYHHTTVCVGVSAVLAVLLSLLPAVMARAHYDRELLICWLLPNHEAVRWAWMSMNAWVVLALAVLVATSACIGVLLSNERRNVLHALGPESHRYSALHQLRASADLAAYYTPRQLQLHGRLSCVESLGSCTDPVFGRASICSHCYASSTPGPACPLSARSLPKPPVRPLPPPPQSKHTSLPVAPRTRHDHQQQQPASCMSRSTGQLRRIEERIQVLIATGAMRVAMRAMVPLLTQLPLVAWSSVYAGGRHRAHSLYMAATLALSIQGLLDMMLYYIFDTQNDAPTLSMPSHYAQTPRSVSHIAADVYYTPYPMR
ncbi:hypothetical protein IWW52_000201 [Coemansia sp. RSA 2704]|nr:hypothetical protein IWW52_000201 [Coemansia sp. RSA 2704]